MCGSFLRILLWSYDVVESMTDNSGCVSNKGDYDIIILKVIILPELTSGSCHFFLFVSLLLAHISQVDVLSAQMKYQELSDKQAFGSDCYHFV